MLDRRGSGAYLRGMPPSRRGDHPLATEVWRRLFALFMANRPQRDRELKRLGLTVNDAKALHTLHLSEGRTMRSLAEEWATDASNATWIVDRLERLGFAERRSDARDRRVKLVVLTRRGARARQAMMRCFHRPPPELLALAERDLRELGEILERIRRGGVPEP